MNNIHDNQPSISERRKMFPTLAVLDDVHLERLRQKGKWGGTSQDDGWNALDWHEMIADYNAWARRMACMGSKDKARNRYIQIAALAVAAVEALDRRESAIASRHAAAEAWLK